MSGSRDGVVERALAEPPPGGVERPPGLVADLAVDAQAAALLEGAHGDLGRPIELGVGSPASANASSSPSCDEDAADLGDRRAAGTMAVLLQGRAPLGRLDVRPPARHRVHARAASAPRAEASGRRRSHSDKVPRMPDIGHAGSVVVSLCVRSCYSADSISLTRSPFGRAPATDCTGWPPLKMVSVGTDITR